MVCGSLTGANVHSFYGAFNTIAAAIVNSSTAPQTDASGLALSHLAELGLVLLVITSLANVGARLLVRRSGHHGPPRGPGDLTMSTVDVQVDPGPPAAGLGRRRRRNRLTWVLCAVALALVVIPVVWIVGGVVARALPHFHLSLLTTYPVGNVGGPAQLDRGTFAIVFGVLVLAGVVGIAGGVYLAEYTREGRGQILRGASEVLAGVPSIVLGYVGYVAFVVALHWGYSIYAGIIVLSILVVPYITKTTEVALRNVPTVVSRGRRGPRDAQRLHAAQAGAAARAAGHRHRADHRGGHRRWGRRRRCSSPSGTTRSRPRSPSTTHPSGS